MITRADARRNKTLCEIEPHREAIARRLRTASAEITDMTEPACPFTPLLFADALLRKCAANQQSAQRRMGPRTDANKPRVPGTAPTGIPHMPIGGAGWALLRSHSGSAPAEIRVTGTGGEPSPPGTTPTAGLLGRHPGQLG